MRISGIAIALLVSAEIAASPLLAQSSLVPHVPPHPAPPAAGTIGLVPGGVAHRGHRFDRSGGTGFGFGFGSGFVFGDAKGFGIGHWDRNDGHNRRWRGRNSGRHDDRGDGTFGYGVGYDGYSDSYASTPPAPDQFGFFGNGGEATLVDGRAVYDYDRSYPYEYYRGPRREEAGTSSANADRAAPSGCETKWVPDGRGGGNVPVRICRR